MAGLMVFGALALAVGVAYFCIRFLSIDWKDPGWLVKIMMRRGGDQPWDEVPAKPSAPRQLTPEQRRTQDLIDDLVAQGAEPNEPLTIGYFLDFPDRDAAAGAAEAVRDLGDHANLQREGTRWMCVAFRKTPLELDAIEAHADVLRPIATARGGRFDGWGVG